MKVSREQKERLIKTANKVRTGLISKSLEERLRNTQIESIKELKRLLDAQRSE